MALKILHTADLHIGMKFERYGKKARELRRARLEAIDRLLEIASGENCDILVITGDLFDRVSVKKATVREVVQKLEKFSGRAVLVLPGNHDYTGEKSGLWSTFKAEAGESTLVLDRGEEIELDEQDLEGVNVYPAPCPDRSSRENRLDLIRDKSESMSDEGINLGIAHGALEGEAPEDNDYYHMKKDELRAITGIDIWLLGHIHQRYPAGEEVTGVSIFMPGTPEPDGLDCSHEGFAWLIEIDEDRNISGRALKTGSYRFEDMERTVESRQEIESLLHEFSDRDNLLLRLNLSGTLPEEVYREYVQGEENRIYEELKDEVFYLELENELRPRITEKLIEQEFQQNSIPHLLLSRLKDEDELTLQMAYDLIREAQK